MNIDKLFNLKDKVAVVTGGAGHLGTAISECLAEAGATIVIADIDEKKTQEKVEKLSADYGVDCHGIKVDISNKEKVTEAMAKINDIAGHIDILVNNGHYGAAGDIENISEDKWQKGIDGTINGVFRCTKAVIPYMKAQGSGVVINIASMYGMVSPDPSIYGETGLDSPPNYGAGKAAIIQFTRYTACHLAKDNIRVNSISPGAFPNEEVQKHEEFIGDLEKKIPLGRIGKPEDLKGIVLFLASDASSYITGTNMVVDGGWTVW